MNHFKRLLIVLVLGTAAISAQAELSANVGFASEYYYRGIWQKDSSASAGLDFEQNGFYAGTWVADVDDGLEVDIYSGYGMEFENGLSLGGGVTGYYYTGETFDDTYEEININLGYSIVSFEYSVGRHDLLTGGDQDYRFTALTVEKNGFYGTYGSFGKDIDGDYFELGYGKEISGFDFALALIFSDENLSVEVDKNGKPAKDEALILSVSKAFDL